MNAPEDLSLPELLARSVARHGELAAVRSERGVLTHGELGRSSDFLAASLADRGVQRGDRVALLSINSPEFALAYLGIVKAGAVVVPVNVLLSPAEVSFILEDAGVSGLLYHPLLEEKAAASGGELGFRIALDGEEWRAMLALDRPAPELALDPAEDLAAILYTSGTTGRPKGAMLTHRNLISNTWSVGRVLNVQPGGDVLLVVLPMFHSFAATCGMLTALVHGLSFAPLGRFEPAEVAHAVAAHGATIFLGVPSMYRLLLRLPEDKAHPLRALRLCVSGGAAMPQELMERFEERFGVPICEGDGPTECSPVTCINPPQGVRKPGSVGRPVPLVEMRILDAGGRELPGGEVGELCVRGPNVMKGYWNLPEETARAFFGPWFRTGDLAWRDEEGYFFIVDRLKDMVIVNGMNVYPRVVEEVLQAHPAVAEAAVVGEPHELHGEVPVAHVVAVAGTECDPSALQSWCRRKLGRHEVPRKIFLRRSLPRNATGKVLKRELRKHGELERGIDSREQ